MNNILTRLKKLHKKIKLEYKVYTVKKTLKHIKIRKGKNLYRYNVKEKSVLIFEINTFHDITMPSIVHYFCQCGYNVNVLIRYENLFNNVFIRSNDKFNIFYGDIQDLCNVLSSNFLYNYDFVFMNTTFYYGEFYQFPNFGQSTISRIGFIPEGKYGIFMIEHNYDPYISMFNEYKYIIENRLFTLLGFRNTKMLACTYLGNVKITDKNNDKTVFIIIGTISSINKNFNLLIDGIEYLLKKGITNFEFVLIGQGKLNNIPEYMNKYINVCGFISNEKMFVEIEKSDYILTLWDPEIKEHHKYKDNWASGSSILMYAFAKPCLIHSFFAESYFLNNNNAIIYSNFNEALHRACNIKKEEYGKIQKEIINTSNLLYNISIKNLKEQITNINQLDF